MNHRRYPRLSRDGKQGFTFRNVQLLKHEALGTGSYGLVCKAKCDQLICAAKLLDPFFFQLQTPDSGREHRLPVHRFEQECQFLSCINHPNIVYYLGTYRDPETNTPVLLMELMDESLTHFLESTPGDIPCHIQVNLSRDVAQALAFLHANGIIHHDLSSNNVLLIAGSRAKVSDFGMSDFIATRPASRTKCPGTPVFMPPEAFDEPPVYSEKLDCFSFGVIVVHILTKHWPTPSDQYEVERIPDRRNPKQMIEAKIPVPELERGQTHISLIESTHPLLSVALECLKQRSGERPSSEQLCQSLDVCIRTEKYCESKQHDIRQLFQEQIQAKEQTLCQKDNDLKLLQRELETKEHQLSILNDRLESNEESIAALQQTISQRDREIAELRTNGQSLQNEVKAKQLQLRKLNEQVESSEEIIATFQHTITERDKEIAELKQTLMYKNRLERSQSGVTVHMSKDLLSMSWNVCSTTAYMPVEQTSALVDQVNIYFMSGGSVWEFKLDCSDDQWFQLPRPGPLDDGFSLVCAENELTTVGGRYQNFVGNTTDSNKLYTYVKEKWVNKYPSMPTNRTSCTANIIKL